MIGFSTLFRKELLRFWKVGVQTVAAPVMTTILYLLIFSHALKDQIDVLPGVPYLTFLIPGLVMMAVLQNAFANTSSSLIQSKISGNLVFILLPPISATEMFVAYVGAAIVRGLMVGFGVFVAAYWFGNIHFNHPLWILVFAFCGSAILGTLGLVAGIWAEKFDQIAAFQNFIIMPFTFLSGVFYSIHSLPVFWQTLSRFNPFFYMVDGFRYGFFGLSDVSPYISLAVVLTTLLLVSVLGLGMLRSGYKMRH